MECKGNRIQPEKGYGLITRGTENVTQLAELICKKNLLCKAEHEKSYAVSRLLK